MILNFDGELLPATPFASRLTVRHEEQLAAARLVDGRLSFPDPGWRATYLGRGEEKACHRVRDHDGRVFVLELIDERGYLNGRFVTGTYFGQRHGPGLGLIKIRTFVYGYEWSRFQWRPDRRHLLDRPLTAWLRAIHFGRYEEYRRRYGDVHERNVLFEVRPARRRGVPVPVRDWDGRRRLARVELQPVDVR